MKRPDHVKDVHTQTPVLPKDIENKSPGRRQVKETSSNTSDTVGTSSSLPEPIEEENYRKTKKYCDEVAKKYLQGHFAECDIFERDQLLTKTNKNKTIEEPEFEVIDGIDLDTETAPGTSKANDCRLPDKDREEKDKDNDQCLKMISNKTLEKKPTKLDNPKWASKNILIREPISKVPCLNLKNQHQPTNAHRHNITIEDSGESESSLNKKDNKNVKEHKNVAPEPEKLSRYFSIIGLKKTDDKQQNTDESQENTTDSANNKKIRKLIKRKQNECS